MSELTNRPSQPRSLTEAQRARLEERIRSASHEVEPGAWNAIGRLPPDATPVMSPGQERLWFQYKLDPAGCAYNMFLAVRLVGGLRTDVVKRALAYVTNRHPSLRTRFPDYGERARPLVVPAVETEFSVVDLTSDAESRRERNVRDAVEAVIRKPFGLETGPPFRAGLVRIAKSVHVLVLAMHHIVSDERSLDIVWSDFASAYRSLVAGAEPVDAGENTSVIEYADYAAWLRSSKEEGRLDRHVEYWKEQLAGLTPLGLSTDFRRPLGARSSGKIESLEISGDAGRAAEELRRELSVTPFVFFCGLFQILLHRYADRSDVAVGVPVSGRNRVELERLVGFILNTVVLRADLSCDPSFRNVVTTNARRTLDAIAHAEVPFETLVDELNPRRVPGRNPLFDVMFVWQDEASLLPLADDIETSTYDEATLGASKFDLTLFAQRSPSGFRLMIEYRDDLYEGASIRRLLRHLQTLLESAIENPDTPVSKLLMVGEEERAGIVALGTGRVLEDELFGDRRLHEIIEAVAEQKPDSPAIFAGDAKLTYRDLNHRANRIAARLIADGFEPGSSVGVCLKRSIALPIAILGVLKAGGAYVPMDVSSPHERLAYVATDAGVNTVIVDAGNGSPWPSGVAAVAVDDNGQLAEPREAGGAAMSSEAANPRVPVHGSALAYIMYTSGSTGRPKGVMVSHDNVVFSTVARQTYYGKAPSRFLLLSPPAFDSSVAGLFWTLTTGGAIVMPHPRQEQDIHSLATLIRQRNVTHTLCVPSLYAMLLRHADPVDLQTLETVIVAGEVCPTAVADLHHEVAPETRLFNEYGPTEATVWCTVHEVSAPAGSAPIPIGRPIPGARVYIVDRDLQIVPQGVPGELCVGGPGVARGYVHNTELTAARFVREEGSGQHGDRMYRTGDRARFAPDGTIEFLGRMDDQLKVRGYRIEPGEIESVLASYPGVADAVVIGVRGGRAAHRSTAIDVSTEALADALRELDDAAAERLLQSVERAAVATVQ